MKRTLIKSLMLLALGAVISLPGMAAADYTFSSITGYFGEQSISGLAFDRIDTTSQRGLTYSPRSWTERAMPLRSIMAITFLLRLAGKVYM